MNDFCTCGAHLVPDARFCHKCGKPQGELIEPDAVEAPVAAPAAEPLPAAALPEAPADVSLRNPVVIRVAMMAGAATSVLLVMPLPPMLQLLWQMLMLLAGGFLAVYIYRRRTGKHLNLRSGAYLGWIAGFFCFLIMLVLFTISIVAIANGEGLQQSFREMIAARGNSDVARQFDELLRSPAGLGALLVGMLLTSFIMVTILPTIGGALGARVLDKE